jgi:hypothetical protein
MLFINVSLVATKLRDAADIILTGIADRWAWIVGQIVAINEMLESMSKQASGAGTVADQTTPSNMLVMLAEHVESSVSRVSQKVDNMLRRAAWLACCGSSLRVPAKRIPRGKATRLLLLRAEESKSASAPANVVRNQHLAWVRNGKVFGGASKASSTQSP